MTTPDIILLLLCALSLAWSAWQSWQLRKADKEWREQMRVKYGQPFERSKRT